MEIDRLAELRYLALRRVDGATDPAQSNLPDSAATSRRLQTIDWFRHTAHVSAATAVPSNSSMLSTSAGVHVTSAGPDMVVVTVPSSVRADPQRAQTAAAAQVPELVSAAGGNAADGSVRGDAFCTPRTRATTATGREA